MSAAAVDYDRLASQHRPTDPAAIAAEIRRLVAGGLRPRDVSVALRLDLAAVLNALRPSPSPATVLSRGRPESPPSGSPAAAGDLYQGLEISTMRKQQWHD